MMKKMYGLYEYYGGLQFTKIVANDKETLYKMLFKKYVLKGTKKEKKENLEYVERRYNKCDKRKYKSIYEFYFKVSLQEFEILEIRQVQKKDLTKRININFREFL